MKFLVIAAVCLAAISADPVKEDQCTCTENGNTYTSISSVGCASFFHEPSLPLVAKPCPPGLLFDVEKCVCNWPQYVTCGVGCGTGGDVDECATNNGGCSDTCTNTVGSYFCSCPSGHSLGADQHTCVDDNECLINNGGCAQVCTNNVGSYDCSCAPGYTVNAIDRHRCDDINECLSNNGGCSDICLNVPGSYTCDCPGGSAIGADGRTCV